MPKPPTAPPSTVTAVSQMRWISFLKNGGRWLAQQLGFGPPPGESPPVAGKAFALWPPLVTALVLMLVIVTIPPPPMRLHNDVDSSTSAVLSYAHEHGWQHGTDLVFTYGPLGFLTFFYFTPDSPGRRMVADLAAGTIVAVGVCFVAWRLRLAWRVMLLGLVGWIGANVWPRTDWLLNTGLLCWGLLCFVESGRRLWLALAGFLALGVFAALSKASFLVLVAGSVMVMAVDLIIRGRRRLASGTVLGFVGAYLIGWQLAGQDLLSLGNYLANALAMIRGYNQTLGWEGSDMVRASGWRLAWILPPLVGLRTLNAFAGRGLAFRWRRCWLTLWVGFFTFTLWKHGWVRVDPFHVGMFLSIAPVLALALEVLPARQPAIGMLARGLAVVAASLAVLAFVSLYLPSLSRSLIAPYRALVDHADCTLRPHAYFDRMRQAMSPNEREAQLPRLREIIGESKVDVFGQHAGYALYNGFNYRPRPVFQSYAACNATLMKLNQDFYRSPAAPGFVLFRLEAMDGKFPPLEDAWVLRHLLANYEPVAAEQNFLLLKQHSSAAPRLTLLRAGEVRPGERIDLRQFGDADLWLEVNVQPTLVGRLRTLFSRPAIVKLATWRDSGQQWNFRHRGPPAMLAAGFVASPLLLRNNEVLNLYAGTKLVRPVGYSVEVAPEDARFWSPQVSYRISRIEPPPGRRITAEAARQLLLQATNAPPNNGSPR